MEKKMVRGRSKGHPWEAEKFDEQFEYMPIEGPSTWNRKELAGHNLAQNVRGYVTRDAAKGTRQVHDEAPATSGPGLGVGRAAKGFAKGVAAGAKDTLGALLGQEREAKFPPDVTRRARTKKI